MHENQQLQEWWGARTDGERDLLRRGNKQYPMDSEATKLLFDTQCPALPADAAFGDVSEGFAFGMPGDVAELINEESAS